MIDEEHVNKMYCDIYEIPPGKTNWPLHYHTCNEEIFYIIEGFGEVVTESGVLTVKSGDILRFPAGEKGVHQLKNTSDSETPTINLLLHILWLRMYLNNPFC
jgi:uncharacterized cupin superfamily protein